VAWLLRVEFGAVALVFCAVLARLLLREARVFRRVRAAEDWMLLAAAAVTAARVTMGAPETAWVWGFGLMCAAYLAAKGMRATRVEN
jgi:hypothetical protein